MFKLYIDCRERHLIELFEGDCTTKALDIGDILITDENEKVYCIIERKSIKDLNASLKDGRYKEQKHRLINNFNKKHILYILEDYVSFESLDDKKLESAVIHSLFRDETRGGGAGGGARGWLCCLLGPGYPPTRPGKPPFK